MVDISSTPSRISPRRLQKRLRTNGGGEWDNILSNVLIYTATPSITGLQTHVIHNNNSKSGELEWGVGEGWRGGGEVYIHNPKSLPNSPTLYFARTHTHHTHTHTHHTRSHVLMHTDELGFEHSWTYCALK